jgi:ribosomal protein S18 acetylase RimI-like enzyme
MEILKATVADAAEILTLQKLAYQSEAERYNNYDIPPLKETLDEIKDQFRNHIFLKAVSEGRTIGTVRAYEENGTCYIGRLAVHPDSQNRGIGSALMKAIEDYYKPQRFELFVGSKSEKNIYLYKKLGYTIYKTGKHGCGDIEIFYMEKYCKNI